MNAAPVVAPRYLRVVMTARCNYSCSFCHMEGDPARPGLLGGLPLPELIPLVAVAIARGVRKVKFLGGEPLLRRDFADVVERVAALAPGLDISVITAGAYEWERLEAALARGLARANLSIHGFSRERFAVNNPNPANHARRDRVLAGLLATGRRLKLNYVWTGPACRDDLIALADYVHGSGAIIGLLDQLGGPTEGYHTVAAALRDMFGEPKERSLDLDPNSLPTEHWRYDGLTFELKHVRLGDVTPYSECHACPKRASCSEGIRAIRLMHDGRFQPCMDRPDLSFDGVTALRCDGPAGLESQYAAWLNGLGVGGVAHVH